MKITAIFIFSLFLVGCVSTAEFKKNSKMQIEVIKGLGMVVTDLRAQVKKLDKKLELHKNVSRGARRLLYLLRSGYFKTIKSLGRVYAGWAENRLVIYQLQKNIRDINKKISRVKRERRSLKRLNK